MLDRLAYHQRTGAEWVAERMRGGCLLCDATGMGKTRTALAAARLAGFRHIVVVAPPSKRSDGRAEHYDLFGDGGLTAEGFTLQHAAPTLDAFSWYARDMDAVVAALRVMNNAVVIFDEAHRAKSPNTRAHKLAARMSRRAAGSVALTATPLTRNPLDVYYTLRACVPGARDSFAPLARFVDDFVVMGEDDWSRPRPVGAKNMDGLRERLAPFLLSRNGNSPEMPRAGYRSVDLRDDNATEYLLARCEVDETRDASGFDAGDDNETLLREVLATGLAKARMLPAVLGDWVPDGTPLLSLWTHKAPCLKFARATGAVALTGDDSIKRRAELIADFMDGRVQSVAGTYSAIGEGLNIGRAKAVLIGQYPWTSAALVQGVGRALRWGGEPGERPVFLPKLSSSVLDHVLLRVLKRRRGWARNIGAAAAADAVLAALNESARGRGDLTRAS